MYDKRSARRSRRARASSAQLQIQAEARLTPDAFAEAIETADCLIRVERSRNPLVGLFGEARDSKMGCGYTYIAPPFASHRTSTIAILLFITRPLLIIAHLLLIITPTAHTPLKMGREVVLFTLFAAMLTLATMEIGHL
jgi:hypothetical protein